MTVGSQDTVALGGVETIEVDATWAADAFTLNAYTGQAVSIGGLNRTYDIFIGDASINTLNGTSSSDALIYDTSLDAVFPAAAHLDSIEQFNLVAGSDVLNLTSGPNGSTSYAVSISVVMGWLGQDTIWTGSGNDLVVGDFNVTTGGLFAAASDRLHGGAGNDQIFGDGRSVGGDVALANDWIDGGTGNDTLFGDGQTWGADFTGTRGNNIFAFDGPGSGQDQIGTGVSNGFSNGFQIGLDKILLDPSYGFTVAQVLTRIANNANGDAVVDLGNGDTVTLVGVSAASLTAADFVVQSVTAVAAPSGADKTVTIDEDNSYTFSAADFGFSDPNEFFANTLKNVIISQLPTQGTLSLNNVAVTLGQSIAVASIPSLVFTPVLNGNGINYASFTFQVQDDGLASINGGQDLDASANNFTFNVNSVNDAPTLNNNTGLTMAEGGSSVITASKLGYSDVEQTDAQLVYTITSQTAGTVVKNGTALGVGGTFTQGDIDGGLIEFRHDGGEGAAAGFGFSLSDGANTISSSFAITVTPVDDAPTGLTFSNAVTSVAENTVLLAPLKVADIGITDVDGGPNTLSLSGADAALFDLVGASLFLKAGTVLDFETKTTYAVSVDVNDANLATSPDASKAFTLSVTDVNEAPTAVNFTNVLASIAENASTAARIKVADIAITDDALGSETITLAGADAAKFEVINGVLYIKAGTVLNFEADSSLDVTVIVNDPTVGGPIDVSRALSVKVTDVLEAINGTGNPDTINGGTGADRISGLAGNDTISGGAGNDKIIGGAGADVLIGGPGADTFIFASATDSAYKVSGSAVEHGPLIDAGSSLRDIITDFTVGVDKIDVSLMDANENVAGNQTFTFRGTGNFAGAGSIVYRQFDNAGTANDHTVVYFDTTGDGRSDMLIALNGLKALTVSDFIL